jgi:hypothetical protein
VAASGLALAGVSPVSATAPLPSSGTNGHAPFQTRPNVVVVMTDDMRADELRFLPAVRRLQRAAVTFTNALSADSLCCPARATLLTGKLAHNHLTIGNDAASHGGYQVFAEHNDLEHLLPQWLDSRGYRAAGGLPPARLELLRRAGEADLQLPRELVRDRRPVPHRQLLPGGLPTPVVPVEGQSLGTEPATVLRPLQRAGAPPVGPGR